MPETSKIFTERGGWALEANLLSLSLEKELAAIIKRIRDQGYSRAEAAYLVFSALTMADILANDKPYGE